MKRKINHDEYSNIAEFRSDFELMCDNAMKYNRPDTIYWQAAKKLLAFGSKLMNKDKLISYRRTVECFAHLTERELGFRIDSSSNSTLDDSLSQLNDSLEPSNADSDQLSSISISQACSQRKPKLILKLPKIYNNPPAAAAAAATATTTTTTTMTTTTTATVVVVEEEEIEESTGLVDDISPEDLLLQVQQASQIAREKFQQRQPIFSYTVAYQRRHAQSALRMVNQDDMSEQTIPLMDANHLSLPTLESEKEQYNAVRDFLDHGPFSSQSTSQNDSTLASLPKEELDLLIHTYGSEFSAQYAMSMMDFIKDSGDLALVYVDRFLSVLTNGEHDNFVLKKREKPEIKEEPQLTEETPADQPVDSAVASIKVEPEVPNNDQEGEELSSKVELNPTESTSTGEPTALPDYDFPDLPDLAQLTNGPDQLISGENPSAFDAF